MKKLYASACTVFFILAACQLQAQVTPPLNQHVSDKPVLFAALPQKLECNLEEVDRLFTSEPTQKLVLKLNAQLLLEGTVTEKTQRSPEILSINFQANNYNGALFNITRIIQNGTIRYTGRIMNRDNGDILMLVKEREKYYFTKQSQRFVMVE